MQIVLEQPCRDFDKSLEDLSQVWGLDTYRSMPSSLLDVFLGDRGALIPEALLLSRLSPALPPYGKWAQVCSKHEWGEERNTTLGLTLNQVTSYYHIT